MNKNQIEKFSQFCSRKNIDPDVQELILELATVARSVQDDASASTLVRKHANDVLDRAYKLVCGKKARCSVNNQCRDILVANMMAGFTVELPDDDLLTGPDEAWYC